MQCSQCDNIGANRRIWNGTERVMCQSCFFDLGKKAPGIKNREHIGESMMRVARAERAVAGEPTEMERILAAQEAQLAADDLLQMKKELEGG